MTITEVFIQADRALNEVVQQIKDDQWEMKLPEWFQVGRTQNDPSLREILNYHAQEDAWVPDGIAGKTMEEVGDKYAGDQLGDDPKGNFQKIVDKAVAVVGTVGENDLDKPLHFSYGDYPIKEGLKHLNYFRGIRAIDIAKVIGVDDKLPADLVQGLWDEIAPDAETWRQMGVFGPAVDVPEDAPLQDRLLGLTGRQP